MARDGDIRQRDPSRACAYCGQSALTGDESPEHPIPHALGSSLEVFTVCAACNGWANIHVDQPFLRDDWTRLHRAEHDVRDPRRPHEPVPHPFRHGFTEDGVYVTVDETWTPHLRGRIIEEPGAPDRVRVIAGSVEEAERLKTLVIERATAKGMTCEIGEYEHRSGRPTIRIQFVLKLDVWLRAAAKMALGIASSVYPPEWRTSADAEHLRHLMRSDDPRDRDGQPITGLYPERLRDDLLSQLAVPPEHVVWFVRGYDGHTRILIMLFGELMLPMIVDTECRLVPEVAWRLDPRRPRAGGATTWDGLVCGLMQRLQTAKAA